MASPSLTKEQVIRSSSPAVGDEEDNSMLTFFMIRPVVMGKTKFVTVEITLIAQLHIAVKAIAE